jgi:hypothetical protein
VIDVSNISEECPNCGNSLLHNVQSQIESPQLQQQKLAELAAPFRTAYDINAKLTFGIGPIDNHLNIRLGDRICIAGNRHYSGMFVARSCVRALMSRRHGGFQSNNVLVIDAGNSYDVYRHIIFFARQYGLDLKAVLRSVRVSRVFTTKQLTGMIVRKLNKLIEQLHTKVVVIPDLLALFVEEQQTKNKENRYLINQIAKVIQKLTHEIVLIVSFAHNKREPRAEEYENMILPSFRKCLEIVDDDSRRTGKQERQLLIALHNGQGKLQSTKFNLSHRDLRIVAER